MITCAFVSFPPGASGSDPRLQVCGAPAEFMFTWGCVHEHGHTEPVCKRCLDDCQGGLTIGAFHCDDCARGPEPHQCLPHVIKVEPIQHAEATR